MDDKKINKGARWFWTILIILFIVYMSLNISIKTGYYENKLHDKVLTTEESIRKFESDLASGIPIDIDNYIEEKDKDYNNKISSTGYEISKTIENVFNNGLEKVFNFLSVLVTNN